MFVVLSLLVLTSFSVVGFPLNPPKQDTVAAVLVAESLKLLLESFRRIEQSQKSLESQNSQMRKAIADLKTSGQSLSSGVKSVSSEVKSVSSQVSRMLQLQHPLVVYSQREKRDDGKTEARCPGGYKLVACLCVEPLYCDGEEVLVDGTCRAYGSARSAATAISILARATCIRAEMAGQMLYMTSSRVVDPTISCPPDYKLIDCGMHSIGGNEYIVRPHGIITGGGNTCMPNTVCRAHHPCIASAVCQKQ